MNEEKKYPTEEELRDSKPIWAKTLEELNSYIESLVERPQDYGTCVYAMSLSAVAALYYVAGKLNTTGFQTSCADLDILRHTRRLEIGCVTDYTKLLYPQYMTDEHFPTMYQILERNAEVLGERAAKLLVESPNAHPDVLAHWKLLVRDGEAASAKARG